MYEKRLAIITARGGSKRIPKKNIKEFMGKPMLAYAIEAARESGLFDTIMVSTDAEDIAEVARRHGAEVPFMRSQRNSSDHATTADVIEEVVEEYRRRNQEYDELCCIYPCVPFLTADTLRKAHERMRDMEAVLPVCRFSVPVEWALEIRDGLVAPRNPQMVLMRSQDLEPAYYDVGMFYFVRTDAFLRCGSLGPPRTAPYLMDEMECQDIDTPEDWKMAEMKYRLLHMEAEKN